MAREHEYWTAAGLLLVHSAIAYADAVSIHLKEITSTGENHMDAVGLLREVTSGIKGRDGAVGHLERLIREKNRAAYTGQSFRSKDVEAPVKHAERFQGWAGRLLQ